MKEKVLVFSFFLFCGISVLNLQKGNIDTDTLFVGNLPESVDEEEIRSFLSENFEPKPKEVRVVKEKHVAFVQFQTNEGRGRRFLH